jgi:hypothetical protein
MSHKDAPPETPTQVACREWWQAKQPHVKRAWGRAKDGTFFAEESRLLHESWKAAMESVHDELLAGPTTEREMKYTPEEIAELLKDKPHQPHYIAAMVRKAVESERERCATICDDLPVKDPEGAWFNDDMSMAAYECAAAIRAS